MPSPLQPRRAAEYYKFTGTITKVTIETKPTLGAADQKAVDAGEAAR